MAWTPVSAPSVGDPTRASLWANMINNMNLLQPLLAASLALPLAGVTGGTTPLYSFSSLGSGCTLTFTVSGGVITAITSVVAAGSGYKAGDLITVNQVGSGINAVVRVLTLSGSGVATVELLYGGTLYTAASGVATIPATDKFLSLILTGTLTANITLVMSYAVAAVWSIANNTTGAYSVTVRIDGGGTDTATGAGVVVPQGSFKFGLLETDGFTDVWNALTYGATQNSYDNSTLLATDAYAKNLIGLAEATVPLANVTGGTFSFGSKGSGCALTYTVSGSTVNAITAVAAGGSGYAVGDIIIISVGNFDCHIRVLTLSGSAVATVAILYGGTGYVGGTAIATQAAQSAAFKYALSGVLTSAATFILTNNNYLTGSKAWIFANNCTGSFPVFVFISNGSDAATGNGVQIQAGTSSSLDTLIESDGVTDVWLATAGNLVGTRWGMGLLTDSGGYRSPKAVSVTEANLIVNGAWASQTTPNANTPVWSSVCWSPELGLFVAVSSTVSLTNGVMTSPDGKNWTQQTCVNPGASAGWTSVCWAAELGLFCAVGGGAFQVCMTSPDGIIWTSQTIYSFQPKSICWSPELGLFVAVGTPNGGAAVATSPDGKNWTGRSVSGTGSPNFNGVCWSAELGLFGLCASSGGLVATSSDGVNFAAVGGPYLQQTCWSAELGLFVGVSGTASTHAVQTSPDFLNWTQQTNPDGGSQVWNQIVWSPETGLFMAIGTANAAVDLMTSPDGKNWTLSTTGGTNMAAVAWSPELGIFLTLLNTAGTAQASISKKALHAGRHNLVNQLYPDVTSKAFTSAAVSTTCTAANIWYNTTITFTFTPKFTGNYEVSFSAGVYNSTAAADAVCMKIIETTGSPISSGLANIYSKGPAAATATAPCVGTCWSTFILTQNVAYTFTLQVASDTAGSIANVIGSLVQCAGGWQINRVF